MKKIKTVDAVGRVLLHDITKIVPGEFKGRAFKKGHVIKEEDIDVLLSLGKDNIYVWEETEGLVHENDAAIILKDISCGDGLEFGEIKEGKIDFFASYDGVLKIDKDALLELNMIDDIMTVSYTHLIRRVIFERVLSPRFWEGNKFLILNRNI